VPVPARSFFLLLSLCLGCFFTPDLVGASATSGSHDPDFDKIPFKDWIAGPDSGALLKWSVHVPQAQLSFHQRLVATVNVQLDGAELARRRGKGQFVVFTQFTDVSGNTYQSHTAQDLTAVEEGVSASNVQYLTRAFVLPGEYRVSVLLLNSASNEHWSKTVKAQFANVRHDPFPAAWKDLPPVEFVPTVDPPESWLLPGISDRLNLPLSPRNVVRMDVIVNLTPSERQSGSTRIRNETLGALIPTLKVISEMRSSNATINIELLDLSRRRIVFRREDVQDLTGEALKDAFAETSPTTIDVKSLENRGKDAAFFVKQVSRAISTDPPAGTKHVIVILSATTAFDSGEDLRPIEATPGSCPVFYIRYQAPIFRQVSPLNERGFGLGRNRGFGPPDRPYPSVHAIAADQLEKTLKPVSPELFDVTTPEDIRKALGAIRAEIDNL
jgi:hypothetical protein